MSHRRQARAALTRINPARQRGGQALGLRDGAILALVAGGLSAAETARLRASDVTMSQGRLLVTIHRDGEATTLQLPADLGGRVLAWLTECRQWAAEAPLFPGHRRPLTRRGIAAVLDRYRSKKGRTRKW